MIINVYSKWYDPKDVETAFKKVKYDQSSFERFQEWVDQVRIDERRNATSDEDM